MKKHFILVIALLALVSMMIAPVMAETLTGTLGGSTSSQSTYSAVDAVSSNLPVDRLYIKNIQNSVGTSAVIRFEQYKSTFTDANISGGVAPFTATKTSPTGKIVAFGTISYQRVFNLLGVEQPGYQILEFDSWNLTDETGSITLYLNFNRTLLNGWGVSGNSGGVSINNGDMVFGIFQSPDLYNVGGNYLRNSFETIYSAYTITKPERLGINGSITKLVGGVLYPSQLFVTSSTDVILSSQNTIQTTDLLINTNATSIKIKMYSPLGTWYNSSILFAAAAPTVTPTPTPTIPAGYIVTYFRTFDPLGNAEIHGTNISLYDVEAATWTNYTNDADGRGEIYTLPYHTINAYGTYPTAGVYNNAELLGFETGYSGGKVGYLDMYPYTPAPAGGYTQLYTTVRDSVDKSPVYSASIGITTISTGAYYGTNSGSTGVSVDTFPNQTALRIVVSKAGYSAATISTNTGTGTTKYVYVDLVRATVSPTVTATPLPGEITVRPSYSPGCDPSSYDAGACSSGKDLAMMDQVRDAGPMLIGLAILATVFGLLKLIAKK